MTILRFRSSRRPTIDSLVERARDGGWEPQSQLRDMLRRVATSGSSRERTALDTFLRTATPRDWIAIDSAVRTPEQHRGGRGSLLPDIGTDIISLGLSSMDASGFRRATAVERLTEIADPLAGPFLAIRSVDWVEEVASKARAALVEVTSRDTAAMTLAAPLVLALAGRTRATSLVDEFFQPAVGNAELQRSLLASSNAGVRRKGLEMALSADSLSIGDLINLARLDRDSLVAQRAGGQAVQRATASADMASLISLLEGRALIRRAVLDALPGEDRWRDLGLRFLFDRSPLVRAGAQALLRRTGTDPADLYRHAARADERRAIAVLELGYAGSAADLPLLSEMLRAYDAPVRRSAVIAVHRLLGADAVGVVKPLLRDEAPSVVRAVGRSLRPFARSLDVSELHEVARDTKAHSRMAALRLMRRRVGWERLEADLLALTDPDDPIRGEGARDLVAWVSRDAARAPQGSLAIRRRLAGQLATIASGLDRKLVEQLRFHAGLRDSDLRLPRYR